MRTAQWLLVVVAIGAIAQAEPVTGTVVVSCNEADASLLVDGVPIPERTPAVLTLPAGTHVIEARKPPLVAQKKVIEVADQRQIKLQFELVPPAPSPPPAPPATGSAAPVGSGSGAPPASGSGAPTASGSGAPPAGSGAPTASGSGAPTASGSGAPMASGSAAPPAGSSAPMASLPASAPAVNPSRCTEGGREIPCSQGPHCIEGGKAVPCTKSAPPLPPPATVVAVAAGSGVAGAGSNAAPEPLRATPGAATIEIATTVPRAIAYVDGAPVHEAPCTLELEPGEHLVAVYAAGMVPAEATVHVDAAQRQRVELIPSKPRRRIDVPAQ